MAAASNAPVGPSAILAMLTQPVVPASDLVGKVFVFERGYNHVTRADGWRPLDIPEFDPVAAPMTVHDHLEHFSEFDARVHSEYMALGAAFFTRHKGRFFSRKGIAISDALPGPALIQLFFHIFAHDLPTEEFPAAVLHRTSPGSGIDPHLPLPDFDVESEMMRFVANGRALLRRVRSSRRHAGIDESLSRALPWLRYGYYRATLRYEGIDPVDISKLFNQTAKQIERDTAAAGSAAKYLVMSLDPAAGASEVAVGKTLQALGVMPPAAAAPVIPAATPPPTRTPRPRRPRAIPAVSAIADLTTVSAL